jgi:hypothetical protein
MSSLLQRGLSQAYHEGSLVWLPQIETVNSLSADGSRKKITSWHRGTVQVRLKKGLQCVALDVLHCKQRAANDKTFSTTFQI